MYLFFRKIGASCVSRSRICARAFSSCLSVGLMPRDSRMLTCANSSFSKLSKNSRTRARATGSPGISWGCGKRSSMYSLMMCDSYRMRSRSTRMHLVVRVHQRDVFGLGKEIDVADLEVHSLFEQHEAAAVRVRVGGS